MGIYAFHACKELRSVVFGDNSRLEKIGNSCFAKSGLESIRTPSALKEIGDGAF